MVYYLELRDAGLEVFVGKTVCVNSTAGFSHVGKVAVFFWEAPFEDLCFVLVLMEFYLCDT